MSYINLPRRILRRVEKPMRYVGGEWNQIVKEKPEESKLRHFLRFAFCFPDLYEIGMSNLALRILYDVINQREDSACERVFAPASDMRALMIAERIPLFSLETQRPLREFDMLGFTLQYELSFPTILDMLYLAGIPLRSADRDESFPLVVAGGPCVYNCEPIADFVDLFMIGEGEEVIAEVLDLWHATRDRQLSRAEFLKLASNIEGVYVPSLYEATYEGGRYSGIKALQSEVPRRIRKRIIKNPENFGIAKKPLVPNIEIVHDRLFLELFRGCANGCRFCQAGMIYRPVREKKSEKLIQEATQMLNESGYDEIGLLSLSTGDYSELPELCTGLLKAIEGQHVNLSLPSLRLDSVSFDLMGQVATTRKAGMTFAPEAGTQVARDRINKNITEENLENAALAAFKGGWNRLKLYFMIGLPGETDDDIRGIAELAKKCLKLYYSLPLSERPRAPQITVSCSFFIPKPWTPFQWSPQISMAEMNRRQRLLGSCLGGDHRIKFQWHDPESCVIEAVLARGDRRLAAVLERVHRAGGCLESWSDHFSYERWTEALAAEGLDPLDFAERERSAEEAFAWEIIDPAVTRLYLRREYERAMEAKVTEPCTKSCGFCGAASFASGICEESRLKTRKESSNV